MCIKIWKEEKWLNHGLIQSSYQILIEATFSNTQTFEETLISHNKRLEEKFSRNQVGFRPQRDTRDQIFNLYVLKEAYREANLNVHVYFIDCNYLIVGIMKQGLAL